MSISADDIMVTFDERFNTHEHAYRTCPNCGKQADVDTSKVLTSYPPKYRAVCPHCGEVFYPYCSDVSFERKEQTDDYQASPSINDRTGVATTPGHEGGCTVTINQSEQLANTKRYKTCLICGESIRELGILDDLFNTISPQPEICENCREAILEMRKKMRRKK